MGDDSTFLFARVDFVKRRVNAISQVVVFAALVLVISAGCELWSPGTNVEIVNETDGPITLVTFAPADRPDGGLPHTIGSGETYLYHLVQVGPVERWVITDEAGTVLRDFRIHYDTVDEFDSRIVVR